MAGDASGVPSKAIAVDARITNNPCLLIPALAPLSVAPGGIEIPGIEGVTDW
jgi:hypothetical protein